MKKFKFTKKTAVLSVFALAAALLLGFSLLDRQGARVFGRSASPSPEITALPLTKTSLRDTLSLSGNIYSNKTENVYSTLTYPVKEINVKVGDVVKAGDILAVLDVTDLEYEIQQAENNYESALSSASEDERTLIENRTSSSYSVETARLNLERTTSNYNTLREELANGTNSRLISEQNAVATAAQSVENAQASFDLRQREYETNKQLFEAGAIAKTELDSYENSLRTAETELETAKRQQENALSSYETTKQELDAELNSLKTDVASATISYQSAQNNLTSAQSKTSTAAYSIENQRISLEKLHLQFENAVIKAGIDGTITEVNAVVGSAPKEIMFVIEDSTDLYASILIKEYNLAKVQTGQPATITTEATGRDILNGEVSYVAPKSLAGDSATTVEFEAHVKITDYDERVKIGMNAFVGIITDSADGVYAVSSDMIVQSQSGPVVYTLSDGVVREVPVTLGLETATGVEISGNLTDGMPIITNPADTSPGSAVSATIMEAPVMRMRTGDGQTPQGGQGGQAPQGDVIFQSGQAPQGGQAPQMRQSGQGAPQGATQRAVSQ